MRRIAFALPMTLLALVGCAEVQDGPRVVTLSQDRFDIRYVPAIDSREKVNRLAEWVCDQLGGAPRLQMSDQYLPLDLRTSTYECAPLPAPGPAEALESHSG